ncbi:putative IS orf [Escherichia coli M605]|uniref:Putative IS orf n=1 Tax=Escherichia coli M605 TaxID=656417 RepID=F4SYA0_ECOLX|nr:putative IS orf [Escherichia coli M605]
MLQAGAYGGYRALYESGRITEALQRIGELYAIEAEVWGCTAEPRLAARKARAAPLYCFVN